MTSIERVVKCDTKIRHQHVMEIRFSVDDERSEFAPSKHSSQEKRNAAEAAEGKEPAQRWVGGGSSPAGRTQNQHRSPLYHIPTTISICLFQDIRSLRCCCSSCRPPLPMPGGYFRIHRHRMIPPFGPGSSEPPTYRPHQIRTQSIDSSSEATSSILCSETMSTYSSKNRPTRHAPHRNLTLPHPSYYCTASPTPPTNLTSNTAITAS